MRRLILGSILLAGCGTAVTPRPVALLGPQLRQQDRQLVGQQFRTLLDFENPADDAFVDAPSTAAAAGHTGVRGVRVGPIAVVRVHSVLFNLKLPADFTLLGGYVRASAAGPVTATLIADGRPVASTTRDVPAGVWAFAAVDLIGPACAAALPSAKSIELRFAARAGLELDDVLLVDNRRTLAEAPGGWSVRQAGLSWVVSLPGTGPVTVDSLAAGPGGWIVEEVNAVRLRLSDDRGERIWTLLSDGRSILNGEPARPDPVAALMTEDSSARLDRETPGDANNDGYNERVGAYQIVARGPRLRLRLTPGREATLPPMIEIRGLPNDRPVVTADGQLIETTARLSDGTLLIRVPLRMTTPVEITIGVAE